MVSFQWYEIYVSCLDWCSCLVFVDSGRRLARCWNFFKTHFLLPKKQNEYSVVLSKLVVNFFLLFVFFTFQLKNCFSVYRSKPESWGSHSPLVLEKTKIKTAPNRLEIRNATKRIESSWNQTRQKRKQKRLTRRGKETVYNWLHFTHSPLATLMRNRETDREKDRHIGRDREK